MPNDAPPSPVISAHRNRDPDAASRGHAWRRPRLRGGGTDGNERLTVLTGCLLVVLTAAIGVTIIRIGQLMWLHLFLGLVLIGPVALKLASTGYRFVRYYTHNAAYRRKGAPIALLRGLAPFVVVATIALFATGVALLFAGRNTGLPLGMLHKVSFIAWLALVALHVLGHLPEILRAAPRARATRRAIVPMTARLNDRGSVAVMPGRYARLVALAASIGIGVALAVGLIGQFSVWTN